MKTLFTLLLLSIIIYSCDSSNNSQSSENENTYTDTLNVALYEYVPRLDQFKEELLEKWEAKHPNCKLNFVSWSCYSKDPDNGLDVFVFDNIYMSHFINNGFLLGWTKQEIANFEDFLPYAIEGCKETPDKDLYYGIPQIGCTNMLYYRKGDKRLAASNSYSEICSIIGKAIDTSIIPPVNNGLLVDLSSSTTSACLYIDVSIDNGIPYSWNPPMPSADSLSEEVINKLRLLMITGGLKQVSYDDTISYGRAIWFQQQKGKAMINFTEAMSVINSEGLNKVEFKIMPFSDSHGVNLFYTDVVGVNSRLKYNKSKKALAMELANMLTSSEYITACFGANSSYTSPQYLMPVRKSVFSNLSKWPMYRKMYQIIQTSNPQPFRLGYNSRTWLDNNESKIKKRILEEAEKIRRQKL